MDNNQDLRRGIDYIGVNCVFWCHDGQGKILMHRRSQKCRDEQGCWDCGGGAMEFGETFEQTVRREVLEEYGTEPLKIEYVYSANVLRENNGQKTHWLKNLHWVLVDPTKVVNNEPDKSEAIAWFDLDNLPTPLHSQISLEVPVIKKFLEQKGDWGNIYYDNNK